MSEKSIYIFKPNIGISIKPIRAKISFSLTLDSLIKMMTSENNNEINNSINKYKNVNE